MRNLLLIAAFPVLAFAQPSSVNSEACWEPASTLTCDGLEVTLSKPRLVARSRGFLWFPSLLSFGDGRLTAVMSNYADEAREAPTALVCNSTDGGLTWSEPKETAYGECAVSLASGDTVLLPYYLRFKSNDSLTGPYQLIARGGSDWRAVESGVSNSSSYTEVRWLDERHFLVIYDRLANGWNAIPANSNATNSVWVVRGEVATKGR